MTDIDFKLWLGILQWLVTMALAVSVWLRKPGEDAGKAVQLLRTEFTGRAQMVDTHLATIEERLLHMPNSKELAQLEGAVSTIGERTLGLAEGLQSVRLQLNRMEDFLRNQSRP